MPNRPVLTATQVGAPVRSSAKNASTVPSLLPSAPYAVAADRGGRSLVRSSMAVLPSGRRTPSRAAFPGGCPRAAAGEHGRASVRRQHQVRRRRPGGRCRGRCTSSTAATAIRGSTSTWSSDSRGHGRRSGRQVQRQSPARPPSGVRPARRSTRRQRRVVQGRVEVAGEHPQDGGVAVPGARPGRRSSRGPRAARSQAARCGRRSARRRCRPGTASRAVGCSKTPGIGAAGAHAGTRLHTAPEAASTLARPGRDTCADGRQLRRCPRARRAWPPRAASAPARRGRRRRDRRTRSTTDAAGTSPAAG